MIVEIPQTLNGVSYNSSMTIMVFEDTLDQTLELEEGQTLKAVISTRMYNGRKSGTLLQIIK
jgi:hypothetical protein